MRVCRCTAALTSRIATATSRCVALVMITRFVFSLCPAFGLPSAMFRFLAKLAYCVCNGQDFKDGNIKILIATSVAARGLDVKSLVLVPCLACCC